MKETLIFEWPERHHLHLMLPVTVVFAAALHVGLFFVFSIIYPRAENSALDPAQIYFIPPGNEAAGRLQGLLRSADPAVFAPGRGLGLPEPVPRSRMFPAIPPTNRHWILSRSLSNPTSSDLPLPDRSRFRGQRRVRQRLPSPPRPNSSRPMLSPRGYRSFRRQ